MESKTQQIFDWFLFCGMVSTWTEKECAENNSTKSFVCYLTLSVYSQSLCKFFMINTGNFHTRYYSKNIPKLYLQNFKANQPIMMVTEMHVNFVKEQW